MFDWLKVLMRLAVLEGRVAKLEADMDWYDAEIIRLRAEVASK